MATEPNTSQSATEIGPAIVEISERASLLVREEIELAKAEITGKITELIRGAVIAAAAGIFVVTGLIFLLHAAAWGVYSAFFDNVYLGYLVVAVALVLLGAVAGLLAARALKSGSPPVPVMAIDEAKKIRETVSATKGES